MDTPRVWITSFWGFDPQNEGYYGFTYEGNRDWFLSQWQEGDLILIYGADTAITAPEKRHQALGLVEIAPTPITDSERLSEIGLQRKIENNWLNRWTHAFPVIRAAEITRRISIDHIATTTLTQRDARNIASRGKLLTPEEAKKALSLPVRPLNVFGMPPLTEVDLAQEFVPSTASTQPSASRLSVVKMASTSSMPFGSTRMQLICSSVRDSTSATE